MEGCAGGGVKGVGERGGEGGVEGVLNRSADGSFGGLMGSEKKGVGGGGGVRGVCVCHEPLDSSKFGIVRNGVMKSSLSVAFVTIPTGRLPT